ncbi:putative LysR family transcriptional regulator [Gordonia effusa NBRC 100432]|uniref:Putative LysR family transcriptional regulator n=1 Tax=Gordonia effusa NBRC 100432 TaxID=1077974 RepID=H0R508_9ACTN|nr:LysR substrate-binding domain-containing protein [Gordonia effusa]GAB20159.1 putative LysR family transcriptional regulator [Gordonia effusa NBRC 100432]
MLDVRKLRLLRELNHRGTIAAVAQSLSYTPSAVSQQLSALERETGRTLLVRTGRRVALTPRGLLLAEHAEAVLAELERAQAALADDSVLTGQVRLGAFTTAFTSLIVPAIAALARSHPDLSVAVREVDPSAAPDMLRGNLLDVALIHEYDNVPSTLGSGIDAEPLLDEVVFFASTTTPTVEPAEIIRAHAKGRWIVGNPGTLCHTMAVRSCQASGFEPTVTHRVDDFDAVLRLVAATGSVALVPQLGVVEIPNGVVLTPLPIHRQTRVAYRRGSGRQPALAATCGQLRWAASELEQVGLSAEAVNPSPAR